MDSDLGTFFAKQMSNQDHEGGAAVSSGDAMNDDPSSASANGIGDLSLSGSAVEGAALSSHTGGVGDAQQEPAPVVSTTPAFALSAPPIVSTTSAGGGPNGGVKPPPFPNPFASSTSTQVPFDWDLFKAGGQTIGTTLFGAAQSGGGVLNASAFFAGPANQPPLPVAGGDSTSANEGGNFSTLSAAGLVDRLRLKIPALSREAWIALDLNGATILEVSSPVAIAGQLTEYLGLSPLIRDRVANAIKLLVCKDETVDEAIRVHWGYTKPHAHHLIGSASEPTALATPAKQGLDASFGLTSPHHQGVNHASSFASPLQPSFLFSTSMTDGTAIASANYQPPNSGVPSFLSEVNGRTNFSLEHASVAPSSMNMASLIPHAGGSTATTASGNGLQNINIVLHQPTQQTYAWVILENLDTRTSFQSWLKKNRRERVLCDAANMRSFASLCHPDVREEVCRLYAWNPCLFSELGKPLTSYTDLTDETLFKILFFKHGPRNTVEAKMRLQEVKFRFDDSTTMQDRFCPKLRRFCSEWRQSLIDLKYTSRLWPQNDTITHQQIIDCFLACFEIEPEITGPDGHTKVPKSSGMAVIRTAIRDHKHEKLDAIIDHLTHLFDNADVTARANPLLSHTVQPWKKVGTFNQRKRKWNQLAANTNNDAPHRKPASEHPRCGNCGSRGHKCSERTCYWWGHPEAKGPNGAWPAGTPSLRVSDESYKEWKPKRYDIFYSYEENKKQPPKGQKGVAKTPYKKKSEHRK